MFVINLKFFVYLWINFCSGNFRELVEYLNESTDLLAKNTNILDNVLETLDLQQHSLGALYVLVAKFSDFSVSLINCICKDEEVNMIVFLLGRSRDNSETVEEIHIDV